MCLLLLIIAIFIGINHNKYEDQYGNLEISMDELVAIKKRFIISDLIRESLRLRNLKITNSIVRDSIVNYVDLFQSKSDFYIGME